jgi:hypothetical protein
LMAVQTFSFGAHSYFVVKTVDGRDEMKFSCDDVDSVKQLDCRIRSTKVVVPDVNTPSQFSENARRLMEGNDSLRDQLCKTLHLIEPRVTEAKEIVGLLRDACEKRDGKKLAAAYAKMDTLSKKTCIILNEEEYLRFSKGEGESWAYQGREGCFESKKYSIRTDGRQRVVEKTFQYSKSESVACREEKYIDRSSVLKELTDGRVELPGQCRYLYLQ